MDKNVKLSRKATISVVEHLMTAGFIKRSLRDEGAVAGGGRLTVDWTQKGARLIVRYAEALYSIGTPSKRKIEAFHDLLARSAVNFADRYGSGD